jgi:bifunctional enzyme CysN/CysC
VDARKGLVEQSRRHAFLCSLLRVPHMVLCVNKMDLVDYSQEVYEKIADEFSCFAMKLAAPDLSVIPISALHGDNIVSRSENMPWYDGSSLLHHLEHVHIASDRNLVDVRFPVQYVIRPQSTTVQDYRGYAGQIASGVLKPGDEIMVLPSGLTSRIVSIDTAAGPVAEAYPPMSVTIRLADELDISRGDLICRPNNQPAVAQDIEAMICWMDESRPMSVGSKYAIKHTTRAARAVVRDLHYRLDVNTLHRDETADNLSLNEIGRVRFRTTVPLLADDYQRNRTTGGFIVIDETTNRTVGAGMIVDAS